MPDGPTPAVAADLGLFVNHLGPIFQSQPYSDNAKSFLNSYFCQVYVIFYMECFSL